MWQPLTWPMADMIRCLLVIYSQNHVANPRINGNMMGMDYTPQWEPFPSSIVKLKLAPWSKESTCGIVIHPTMGSLQLEYKSLLTHLTMAYRCKTWVLDDSAWFIGFCHSAACQNPGAMGLWPTISTNFIWYMGVSENGETCHFLIDLNSENSGIPWFQTHSSSSQLTWLWKQCQLRFWKSPLKKELI